MGCSPCAKRNVRILKMMGYVQEGDFLRKGDRLIPIEDAKNERVKTTARAAADEFMNRLKGVGNGRRDHQL